jgi:hypothetical protein
MAVIRRHPTGSFNNIAAPNVTAKGKDCKIAEIFAKGICRNASKKVIVAPTSPKVRQPKSRRSPPAREKLPTPMTLARINRATTVSDPRTAIASDNGTVCVASFINVSFSVKVVMATTMYKMPRELLEIAIFAPCPTIQASWLWRE